VVCLIKPQFEAGREKVGKKGVVREKSVHLEVIEMVSDYARSIGFGILGLEFSPIKGPEGNIEYLLYLQNYPQEEAGQEETGQEVAGQEEIKRPDYELSARAIVEQAHGCLD
ncbi:SAM-dependent methyltransferase, partial [Enterocloster bolteae]|uniref:SAM-dependent methyltransferase n=2 Tax=Lachnospiraceae TaxID=186803 RepID=UPI002F4118CB